MSQCGGVWRAGRCGSHELRSSQWREQRNVEHEIAGCEIGSCAGEVQVEGDIVGLERREGAGEIGGAVG